MPCSLCKKSGHNKTTCQKKYSTKASAATKTESDAISKIKYPDRGGVVAQSPILINTSADKKQGKYKPNTSETRLDENSNHILSIEKLNKSHTIKMPSLNVGVNNNADANKNVVLIKQNCKVVSPKSKKCEKKKQSYANTHANERTSDAESLKKHTTNRWKDIEIKDGDKDVLCDMGMIRFLKGPTDDEGEGYIYMYTHCNDSNDTVEQISTFKIGMTKDLPERRIRKLENGNNENYIKVHSVQVSWRRLAENLIHEQLIAKGYHSPRKNVKGGTEWFKGEKQEMINVINLVIRFLNVYALPMQ